MAEGFAAFAESLREDASEPLTWQELADSPAGVLVRSFRLELDEGRVAFVTLTRGADLDALEASVRATLEAASGERTSALPEDAIGHREQEAIDRTCAALGLSDG